MAAHTIRNVSHDGIGYAAVDLPDVRHLFVAAVPHRRHVPPTGRRRAPRRWSTSGRSRRRPRLVGLPIGLIADAAIDRASQIIRDFYSRDSRRRCVPSVPAGEKCWRSKPWASGAALAKSRSIAPASKSSSPATTTSPGPVPQVFPQPAPSPACWMAPPSIFQQMGSLLAGVDVRFHQVVRTWLYLGGIVAEEGAVQRYQELNHEVPFDFYRDIPFLADHLPEKLRRPDLSGQHRRSRHYPGCHRGG